MMPEAYKLVRYLSHNNLANNKISKVDYYMYAYRLEIVRNLMKWFGFFSIVLTKVPTTRSSEPPRSCLLETFALPQGLNGKCPCLSLLSLICRTCTFFPLRLSFTGKQGLGLVVSWLTPECRSAPTIYLTFYREQYSKYDCSIISLKQLTSGVD